ncbi:hypothetical protein [Streptomyces cyaneofuscatus]|uniref:ATP-grasp domain-containing protein n=1 Tax=Streptomyces cyaneofuscatus TaxID=66883 RepID=A0ABZ1F5H2_9ACTN|nr:hypothetical protein [Streptomyces cyaneofuscatus]WSB11505.1 hypothetical protein OG849_31740 [Streptomyces cyaneofuscatus]WSD44961.1 hypothetical protein OG857_03660 [Streptomyces cyaneofuscatus]
MTAPAGPRRPAVLLVTDLAYEARGRRYCDEDIFLASRLREECDVALCHPRDAAALLDRFDLALVRNSGPVLHYQEAYDAFRVRALELGVPVCNPLDGRGDMAGKGYLVELSRAGYPVIPTVDRAADLGLLPEAVAYAVKPKLGADSVGLRFVGGAEVAGELEREGEGVLLAQPRIDFRYEVSFYFVDHDFQYALYAPDPERRWVLEPYAADAADLAFARRFIGWNALGHGIQRVDACRTAEGELLLVELEDLNPYLSLDRVDEDVREAFVARLKASIAALIG